MCARWRRSKSPELCAYVKRLCHRASEPLRSMLWPAGEAGSAARQHCARCECADKRLYCATQCPQGHSARHCVASPP
eukprot:12885318-Prorocentrum_lima.AAC.1